ncbi:hypothetical protein Pcinc_031312 [Petrolisthes cinctipes]|uniref:Chromatin assembly factor 1 subunit A n=1 Tax=Petrolisthes cinctipes TaxID=88211 RepID=A0AAE1EWV9_PETCI|nr:hypothetical protein Pcinc_031312 [Petrolisthes cinctipes]
MEEECEIVAEVENPNKTSPLVKGKLKQSRLPFLPMSSQTSPKAVSPLTQKKRKLSGEGGSSPKTPRSENRQPERETRLKTEKSNDSNPKEAKSGEKKKRGRPPLKEKVVKEKRKRGRPKKTSPKPNGGKNKKVDSSSLLSDDEVSSSVDDESELPRAKKKNLETTRKLLGGLYREPTQEAKISTSTTTEDGEASEEEEISTSSTNCSLKSQVMEGEDKEQISLCSSDEEGEEEEELEISRKKETEGKDSSTGSSKEEDVEVREDKVKGSKDTQKETRKLPAKEDSDSKKHDEEKNVSSDVGDDESVSSRFEMKKKRVLPHGKKGKKMAEQGKNAHNAKTPEDRSEKTKENQKKTDTKAETKRGKKKRTRLGNEESKGVKKCKLANGRPGKEGGEEMKVENKDSEERKSNDSDNSVKNNRNNSEEDCKEEKESDQNVDIDVKQKEKEATEQDEIVENLDGSEKRDSEDDEADSEKDEDKSEATEDGSLNEETGESKTNEHTSESSTSTPGKESKIKDASESDRKTENSKKRKRGKPNGNELGKGKQVGRKEMDRDSLDGKEKTATPKQDGVVSIARFFSPIPKSEGTRRKSLGSEKKNQAQDNKRKEVSDNAETKHDKERKEEKNNDGEQAEENEDKEQQENREEVDHKGSQKHMEGKEIITNDVSKQKEEDKQLMDKSNTEEEDEQEMDESMNMGSGDTSLSPNTSKSPTATSLNSKALTPKTASGLPEKKLTPKQKIRAEEFQRKRLEREKKKQEEQAERERKRKEELAEKERKRKEELAEKEKKRKEKEEERIKLKEEKEKLKEEQKKKKQEELDAKRQIKEEEKQRKEEAKKQAEKEKNKQTEKLKNKFASFFVAKRREVEGEEDEDSGLFKQFRIKEDMRLAPLHRSQLTSDQIANLDSCLSTPRVKPSTMTYLKSLGTKEYMKGSAPRSWPRKKTKDVDNDVEIIEEDDDEEDPEEAALDMAVMQDLGDEPLPTGSQSRAKLLLFFENRRPAYWGTWSKTSVAVSGRRPFARDGVFDYEYDSDDDWEEEETGESLSDSEGEEKEEEEDQYEVDNDFFVPHGYLSDDEAKSDQEEVVEQETDEVPQVDGGRNLKLKQKQAEFDKEMKRKTKELKPRLIGCLWLADKNNNPAYHQLLKVLDPYKAVALCPLPIDTLVMGPEGEERDQEEDGGVATEDKKLKFYRMFPEEGRRGRKGVYWTATQTKNYKRQRNGEECDVCDGSKKHVASRAVGKPCPDGCFNRVTLPIIRELFNTFWAMGNYDAQNTYIQRLVVPIEKPDASGRGCNFVFSYSVMHENIRYPVYYQQTFTSEFNIAFKPPRANTCKTCDHLAVTISGAIEETTKQTLKEELLQHKKKANAGQRLMEEKAKDKNQNIRVICLDLQQSLPVPKLSTSAAVYHRKLWMYNLCIHNLKTRISTMYFWDEVTGGCDSVDIASCLKHWITEEYSKGKFNHLIVFSSNCLGLDKNMSHVLNFLHEVHSGRLREVEHVYLSPGHYVLPCDHDFDIIEKRLARHGDIPDFDSYCNIIRTATIPPYPIVKMCRQNFLDIDALRKNVAI